MDKMNAGFKIEKEEVYAADGGGAYGIALGYKESTHEYVTWGFTDSKERSYYWGHYYNDWAPAYKNYHDRLAREYERMV